MPANPLARRRGLRRRFLDLPLAHKLAALVVVYILVIAALLASSIFAMKTLTATRAYVGGESLWSKAQKEATIQLLEYARAGSPEALAAYEREIAVPLGDRIARIELEKPDPDLDVARQGFLQGRNHPDDVDDLIFLFRTFRDVGYVDRAITVWAEGDARIAELDALARAVVDERSRPEPDEARLAQLRAQILEQDRALTVLEDEFSYTVGAAARWLNGVAVGALSALTVLFVGVAVTASYALSRHISREARLLRAAASRIAHGDFQSRVTVASRDEIGDIAVEFNRMTDSLVASRHKIEERTEELAEAQRLAQLGSWRMDAEGDAMHWSDGLATLLGAESEPAPSRAAFLARVPEADLAALQGALALTLQGGEPLELEHLLLARDGEVRRVQTRARRVTDADGAVSLIGTTQDVTERRRAEEAIRGASIAKPLVRRIVRELMTKGNLSGSVLVRMGEALAREAEPSTLDGLVRAYGDMGLGALAIHEQHGARYVVHGSDLLERAEGSSMTTCSFTLGFLNGAVARAVGDGGRVLGAEVACQSRGDARCVFVVQVKPREASPPARGLLL